MQNIMFRNLLKGEITISIRTIIWFAIIIALLTQVLSYHFDYVYAYRDSIFRTEASRRFLDSSNPGFINQLGSVWLPIPNIIMMPFASINFLWYSGLCGSIINFVAFVISSVTIFLLVKLYTGNSFASFFAFLVYTFNFNILYFQTTAMTEMMYLCFIILLIYYSGKWLYDNQTKYLFYASIFAFLAAGTRYDAWPLIAVSSLLLIVICLKLKRKIVISVLSYSLLPAFFILFWFYYNWAMFGDMLEFSRGRFSTLAQLKYYEDAGRLLTKHNFLLSLKVTLSSISYYNGLLFVLLSLTGISIYFWKNKKDLSKYFPFIFLISFPASLFLLYLGQLIIELPNSNPPGYFNSRYGLYIFPGISFFMGILIYYVNLLKNNSTKAKIIIFIIIIFVFQTGFSLSGFPYNIPALGEAKYSYSQASVDVSKFLRDNYDGEKLLYDAAIFAIFPWSKVNLKDRITFHTFELGEKAMKNPVPYVKWVMFYTKAQNDFIYIAMKDNKNFIDNYSIVFSEEGIEVYKRN